MTDSAAVPPPPPPRPDEHLIGEMEKPRARASAATDHAAQWARWSRAWAAVGRVIEPLPWYQSLDAHTKAHMREAVTKSVLATTHPTMPLDAFVMREMLSAYKPISPDNRAERETSRKAWVERLSTIADAARKGLTDE